MFTFTQATLSPAATVSVAICRALFPTVRFCDVPVSKPRARPDVSDRNFRLCFKSSASFLMYYYINIREIVHRKN